MKERAILGCLLALGAPGLALANQPPGPHTLLGEVSILPVMMLLTLLGGGYALGRLRGKSRLGRIRPFPSADPAPDRDAASSRA